jgi:hypothetical protein
MGELLLLELVLVEGVGLAVPCNVNILDLLR